MEESSGVDERFEAARRRMMEGDFVDAVDRFSLLIQSCPEMEGAWGNRGYCHYELGRDAEALADFDMVVQINEQDAFGHGFRSLVLRNLGRHEEALEAAATAVELAEPEEDVPPARLTRAWLFMAAGQFASALEDLELYLEKTPDDEAIEPMLRICRTVADTGRKVCPDGPEGRLDCGSCRNGACGYSFDKSPNPLWEEQEGRCLFSHCIYTQPQRSGLSPQVCPLYHHDCPGGEDWVRRCEVLDSEVDGGELDWRLLDLPELEDPFPDSI